jgi:YfiH family protein
VEFLRIGGWEKRGKLLHGFGRRGEGVEEVSQRDWKGHSLKEKDELFPLVALRQVHGDRVVVFSGGGQQPEEFWQKEGDALITCLPGYALSVFTADCLPILLFDPVQQAVGIVHAGWRGTAKGVSSKAVEKMREVFRCKGESLLAAMGPGIGPCCLEVDEPVQKAFSSAGLPWGEIAFPGGQGKWKLDLYQANTWLLREAGVLKENIQQVGDCTSCCSDIFYSYRADRKTQGRQMNFIALSKRD